MNPRRTDEPQRCNLRLSRHASVLVGSLAAHFAEKELRPVTRSDVVERAVRALAKRLGVQ